MHLQHLDVLETGFEPCPGYCPYFQYDASVVFPCEWNSSSRRSTSVICSRHSTFSSFYAMYKGGLTKARFALILFLARSHPDDMEVPNIYIDIFFVHFEMHCDERKLRENGEDDGGQP
jgi:hypothetical protein